jgi:hypothetical protein
MITDELSACSDGLETGWDAFFEAATKVDDLVAQEGGLLELEVARRGVHLRLEILDHVWSKTPACHHSPARGPGLTPPMGLSLALEAQGQYNISSILRSELCQSTGVS